MPRGRTKIRAGGGAVASKNKNRSLTNGKRQEISLYAQSHGVRQALDEHFATCTDEMKKKKRTQIFEWIMQIPELEEVCKTARGRNMRRTRRIGSATTLPPDAERVIVLWINSLRADGVPVSSVMLQIKAKDVVNEFNIAPEHFQAS